MYNIAAKIRKNKMYGTLGMQKDEEFYIRKAYHGEWSIDVPWAAWGSVIAWCKETLGECGHNRMYRWRQNYRNDIARIFLRNESDVTLFRLRWHGR
jgi:hypothetical protein